MLHTAYSFSEFNFVGRGLSIDGLTKWKYFHAIHDLLDDGKTRLNFDNALICGTFILSEKLTLGFFY